MQHGIGVYLEDPRGGADAQPLSQACQDPYDQLHGHLFAMQEGAMMLRKIAFARGAMELSPGTATGMAVGTEVAQPEPAAIATARMGAEMLGGIYRLCVGSIGSGRTAEGAWGCGVSCSHKAQWGFWVRPANSLGSLKRWRCSAVGAAGFGRRARSLGQA